MSLPRHERWAILEWATGRSRSWLMARLALGKDEAAMATALRPLVTAPEWALVQQLTARRLAGEPLAYLLGFREFHGHRFWVRPCVLIPRAESEQIVDVGLDWLGQRWAAIGRPLRLLDLGTGSGCLAISLALGASARGIPVEVMATDQSGQALAVARNNALWLGAAVECRQGNWFEALSPSPEGMAFDLIVSNPPYLGSEDPHLVEGDLPYEPIEALVGRTASADGLLAYRQLARGVAAWLEPGGCLLVEHGEQQQEAVMALMRLALPSAHVDGLRDLADRPRLVRAQL